MFGGEDEAGGQPAHLRQQVPAAVRTWEVAFPRTVVPPSRLISEDEFAAHYAAAEFAAKSGMPCDTTVTLSWSLLGCTTKDEVQTVLTSFLKCMRNWFENRDLPAVYFYAHEVSARFGMHTHLAVYIPGEPWASFDLRSEYRTWVQEWAKRYAERHQRDRKSTAVKVQTRRREEMWLHWLAFSYQVKGYDKAAVVKSAAQAPGRRPVYLGDLIAYEWRDPGPVALKFRCHQSESLGPTRRAKGCPVHDPADEKAWLRGFNVVKPYRPPLSSLGASVRRGLKPFRSSYEDGCRDIRQLYPPEFHEQITRLPRVLPPAVAEAELDMDALMRTLRM